MASVRLSLAPMLRGLLSSVCEASHYRLTLKSS